MIICKRPDPPDNQLQEAGSSGKSFARGNNNNKNNNNNNNNNNNSNWGDGAGVDHQGDRGRDRRRG